MPDALSKADRYRKEAAKCHELAKDASPAFLSGFYRRVAVQYLFMAEGELKLAEKQDSVSPTGAVADRRNDSDIASAPHQR
jgi:hypothetical protein